MNSGLVKAVPYGENSGPSPVFCYTWRPILRSTVGLSSLIDLRGLNSRGKNRSLSPILKICTADGCTFYVRFPYKCTVLVLIEKLMDSSCILQLFVLWHRKNECHSFWCIFNTNVYGFRRSGRFRETLNNSLPPPGEGINH